MMFGDAGASIKGKNVLVAEDEMFIALDISHAVESAGGTVVGPAATVEEARKHLSECTIDAAILDVNLLDGDVTPILKSLVERDVPAVVNTGTRLPWEMSPEFPTVPVHAKPTDPEILINAIGEQLASR